jgi:hypothetical protein
MLDTTAPAAAVAASVKKARVEAARDRGFGTLTMAGGCTATIQFPNPGALVFDLRGRLPGLFGIIRSSNPPLRSHSATQISALASDITNIRNEASALVSEPNHLFLTV